MQALKYLNYILAFGLELVLFFSVSYWGYAQGKTTLSKWGLALILFIIVIALWGMYAAPKSDIRLKYPWLSLFRIVMFSLGTFALQSLGKTKLSIAYTILFLISVLLSYIDEKGF
jgi:hypothetical protein